MPCTVDQRARIREAAAECRALDSVCAVDVLDPQTDPQRTWTVECVVEGDAVAPSVLNALTRHRLYVLDVTPRGQTTVLVAKA